MAAVVAAQRQKPAKQNLGRMSKFLREKISIILVFRSRARCHYWLAAGVLKQAYAHQDDEGVVLPLHTAPPPTPRHWAQGAAYYRHLRCMCSEYARQRRRRWRRQLPCASEIWHYSLIDSHLPCLLKSHHYTTLSWLPSFLIYDYDLPRSHTFRVTDSNSCCLLPRTWRIKLHAEIGVGSVGRSVGLIRAAGDDLE